MTAAPAATPVGAPSRVLVVRSIVALLLAVAAAVAAVLLFRHGVQPHPFGPIAPNDVPTDVPRYSGPWIVAAAGALLLAGLLLVSAAVDARRLV